MPAGSVNRTEASGKGHARIFPFIKDDPKGPARTPVNVFANTKVAVETHSVVKGIKGPSWLQFFPAFHIISGIAINICMVSYLAYRNFCWNYGFYQNLGKKIIISKENKNWSTKDCWV